MSAVDYDKLAEERISSTKLYKYDQITAVSQRAINTQLAAIFKVNESIQEIHAQHPDDDWGKLDAIVGTPHIELRVSMDKRSILYFIELTEGVLQYWDGFGKNQKQASLPIKDWTIALSAQLSFEEASFEGLSESVKERLKVLGDYSVQQLLVDLTSANLAVYDPDKSVIGIPRENMSAWAFWQMFMTEYLGSLRSVTNDSVIHYVPVVPSVPADYPVPTIPPTALTFQNQPFILPAGTIGDVSDSNMLIYLQMTGGHSLPPELLAESANWVVPDPVHPDAQYDGTVALSKAIFLDEWLFSKLETINQKSTWVIKPDDVKCWTEGTKTTYLINGNIGWDNPDPGALKLLPVAQTDVDARAIAVAAHAKGQWFQYTKGFSQKDKASAGKYASSDSITQNFVFIPEGFSADGKCEITLWGRVRVDVATKTLTTATGWCEGVWSTKIVFEGVSDGKLVVSAAAIVPTTESHISDSFFNHGSVEFFLGWIGTALKDLSLTKVVADINSVLGDWDFILPGGGDFFMDKVVFNGEQDLLCQLKYKFKA